MVTLKESSILCRHRFHTAENKSQSLTLNVTKLNIVEFTVIPGSHKKFRALLVENWILKVGRETASCTHIKQAL